MISELTKENLTEVLIDFITGKNTTQAEIAKKSGVDKNTISSLVNGGRAQGVTLYKLKKYLISVAYLKQEVEKG